MFPLAKNQIVLLSFALTTMISTLSFAQEISNEQRRKVVAAIESFLQTGEDEAIDQFIDAHLGKLAVERGALKQRLATIRRRARDKMDGVAIESMPGGLRMNLTGPAGNLSLHVELNDTGIADLNEVEADESADERASAIRRHVQAIESAGQQPPDKVLEDFIASHLAPSLLGKASREELGALIGEIHSAAHSSGAVLVSTANNAIDVKLKGPRTLVVRFEVQPAAPFKMVSLEITGDSAGEAPLELTAENMEEVFAKLEKSGLSGVASVKLNGKIVFEKAFGTSRPHSGNPMTLDSMFCIGSTPIDFTIAAILMLESDGKLKLDDSISGYFPNVPDDKKAITIAHLLSGQSGLPDFHHLGTDRDRDLDWIDRGEAESRILNQPLLFTPGSDRSHSHSAFVLLAALIERVSGESYGTFLKTRFFDPAGIVRTGMYGDLGGHDASDFAVGGGPDIVGDPNIPPNWGRASWLVMGSGGMYSSLGDLKKFFDFARRSEVKSLSRRFSGKGVGLGGSDRGFHVVHVFSGNESEALLLLNSGGQNPLVHSVTQALERLILGER
jgi:CubicO group peptidase (beta-lactamase class C family)